MKRFLKRLGIAAIILGCMVGGAIFAVLLSQCIEYVRVWGFHLP